MPKNGADFLASIQFFTVTAGGKTFLCYAITDFTSCAMIEFWAFYTATRTIYGRYTDISTEHFAPHLGSLFAQIIVIGNRGYAGVAILAVNAATSN